MDLLFAHDRGDPFLQDGPDGDSAAGEASEVDVHVDDLASLGDHADDLVKQRWAVVAAEGPEGDRLISLVRPLIERRSEDQGAEALIVRVPPGMSDREASAWKRNAYPALYRERERDRPLYTCILGDLDQVSLATQQALAIDGLPGRLACAGDDGYQAYVSKALRWQDQPSAHARPRSLFYTVHDGTAATRSGYSKLMQPCFARCQELHYEYPHDFPAAVVEEAGEGEPNPDEFLDLAAENHPTVMFSLSHGLGPPRGRKYSPEEARRRQGAMQFGREHELLPADVASGRFLPGGLWFYFACFGAGTPRDSAYGHWIAHLQAHGMDGAAPLQAVLEGLSESGGFVSGIAQAALANPDGPLAILGHVDLAWSYSYDELQVRDGQMSSTNRSENFRDILAKAVQGRRIGTVQLEIQRILSNVGKSLNVQYDHRQRAGGHARIDRDDELALGNLWMFHQDLSGYAVLGDPAARLPLASARKPSPGSFFGRARVTAGGRGEVSSERIIEVEEALLLALAGEETYRNAGRELGVSRDTAQAWGEAYRDAGRKALAEAMRRSDADDPDSDDDELD